MLLALSASAFADETEAVRALMAGLTRVETLEPRIHARAQALVRALKEKGTGIGVEAFLNEFGLDTREGIALMCLAEALLRIPDADTADRLIRGTFEHTQWDKHVDAESWLIAGARWGLLLTGKMVNAGADTPERPAGALAKLAGKFGEPVIREALKKAMRFLGGQFVLGENIAEACKHARPYERKGYRLSYDILGEGARSHAQAEAYVQSYREAIAVIGKGAAGKSLYDAPGISVKLSALHPRYQLSKEERLNAELLPRLKDIALRARAANITVAVDAEEAARLDIELKLFAQLFADPELQGWEGLGFVVQAYSKRALGVIAWLAELSRTHRRRIPLRLVKGAYWDSEIKWAQAQGLPGYPVFTRKEHTDVSYLACADAMLAAQECFYPQFATHNARSVAAIEALAEAHGVARGGYELQRLHGMGEALHDMLLEHAPSRIYAPVGRHEDLLAYLIRRLLENGANTSFVHLLLDDARPLEELIADPIALTRAGNAQPAAHIPLPAALYGAWRNSGGLDFGNAAEMEMLQSALAPWTHHVWPTPPEAEVIAIPAAIAAARAAFPAWGASSVETRARVLKRAADAIEENRMELLALLAQEAGRTLPDGNAEIREAADFCRYYALQARRLLMEEALPGPTGERNTLGLYPRGVFACISPWNFPLSIFVGQIAAALATGNCALAKPAEQTPKIAARAVQLLHAAGVPKDVLQLLPGKGETVGAALVADRGVDGVVFTGSGEAAKSIAQTLAAREGALVPLIAETGGQNCMVVDSSALLEQAVDDIVAGAFGSAGQRCSSARVLYVQEDIADALLELLTGAMRELTLGDPLLLSTDIGPVIDGEAAANLRAHTARMKQQARLIAAVAGDEERFVAPQVFEIGHISELKKEVFGPVLHVIRFSAAGRSRVADDINSTGYGLTFGIHSRVEENIAFFVSRVRAGNMYVNRSMIGATVGVQPFGGEGLSGTGPKAGGPHYLLRFVTERTVSVNTAAIGGNVALLGGEHAG